MNPKTPRFLDTIAAMTAVSVAERELAPDALMLVRLAAPAAVDSGPASYLLNIGPAAEAGPRSRTPRTPRRCGPDHRDGPGHVSRDHMTEALELAIAVIERDSD